jgi:hypothetical protein
MPLTSLNSIIQVLQCLDDDFAPSSLDDGQNHTEWKLFKSHGAIGQLDDWA